MRIEYNGNETNENCAMYMHLIPEVLKEEYGIRSGFVFSMQYTVRYKHMFFVY